VIRRPGTEVPVEALAAKAAPAPRTRRLRTAGVSSSTAHHRFTVTFAAEQVLEAESVVDALHQAQARGAKEVSSIVRIA